MKRKLLILLFVLLLLSILIGTSPIVDYFYSIAAEDSVAVTSTDVAIPDEIKPTTVIFAVVLSSLTVLVAFLYYLRKRKVS